MVDIYSRIEDTSREVCFYCQCEILPGSPIYIKYTNPDKPEKEWYSVYDKRECASDCWKNKELKLEEAVLLEK